MSKYFKTVTVVPVSYTHLTQKSARDFSTKGVNVIGVPKTIDNDVACTEITFGYNTAAVSYTHLDVYKRQVWI